MISRVQSTSLDQRFAAGLHVARFVDASRPEGHFLAFPSPGKPETGQGDGVAWLLELGFLSNPQDERRLRSRSYRARLASAVSKAVAAHFVRIEEANRN